jgi:hypothetical protein
MSAFGTSKAEIQGREFTVGDFLNSSGRLLGIKNVYD